VSGPEAASEKAAPPVKKQVSRPASLPPQPQNHVFTASDKTGAHEGAAAEAEEDLKRLTSLLSRFYSKHNPTKLEEVEDLARVFRGKEHVLNERLRSSYRADLTNFVTGTEGKYAAEKAAPPQAWRPASLPPVTEKAAAEEAAADAKVVILASIRQCVFVCSKSSVCFRETERIEMEAILKHFLFPGQKFNLAFLVFRGSGKLSNSRTLSVRSSENLRGLRKFNLYDRQHHETVEN
jgi:hypothetical protein